jgi:hypothetical protein
VAGYRHTPPPGSGLHQCAYCHDDYVVPVWIEDLGEGGWHLLLRCGQCDTYRDVVVGDEVAHAYDRDLERGARQIRAAIEKLDGVRMAAQVAAFIVALQRDLIDAGDFAASL